MSLVQRLSFNQMTAELEANRHRIEADAATLKEKNLALEERRDYIETVLNSLSTGVISLDQNDCVTTINAAAASILRLSEPPPAWDVLETGRAEDLSRVRCRGNRGERCV